MSKDFTSSLTARTKPGYSTTEAQIQAGFTRVLDHVSVEKDNRAQSHDRRICFYCTLAPETHGCDNARYALQIRAPLRRHDGSEGKDYMVATASLSMYDLIAIREEIDVALAEIQNRKAAVDALKDENTDTP